MKERYGITSGPLADHLPTLTIAAKNLATEMTNFNVENKDLQGELRHYTGTCSKNNTSAGQCWMNVGSNRKSFPRTENIKVLERRVKKQEKAISDQAGRLPRLEIEKDKETEEDV